LAQSLSCCPTHAIRFCINLAMPGALKPSTSSRQLAVAVSLFLGSYALLLPGLTATLFSLKAEMHFLGTAIPMLDLTKSTIGTIVHLHDEGHTLPALLIFLFSVLVPLVKLLALILATMRWGSDGEHLLASVQWVSKWATVDAFCIMTFAAAFIGMPANSALSVNLQLHRGFYCFLAYCILSVAALVSLPLKASPPVRLGRLAHIQCLRGPILLLAVFTFLGLLRMPLIRFQLSQIGFQRTLSVTDMMGYFAQGSLILPLASVAILVVLLPGLHVLTSLSQELNSAPRWLSLEGLGHFAMFDVLALSIAVTGMAAEGLSSHVQVEVLGGARLLISMIILYPLVRPFAEPYLLGSRCLKDAAFVEEL